MKNKNVWLGITAVALLAGFGYRFHALRGSVAGSSTGASGADTGACEHTIARSECPFCTPSLLESRGWCGGHGVPEALCTRCHRDLIPAFQAKGDWCAEHALPESQCRTCSPDLPVLQPPRGSSAASHDEGAFCAEHGVAEAICFICSPGLIEARGPCLEHGVPEALCTRCHPALIPAFQATQDWCAEHALPESQCALCNPGLVTSAAGERAPAAGPTTPSARRLAAPQAGCRTHAQRIQLASPEVVAQVGIATAKVIAAPFRDLVEVTAQVAYPADRRAELASRVDGLVVEVRSAPGQWVTQGEVLAVVDSPALGTAKADLLAAGALLDVWERNHAREVELAERGVGTQRAVIEADTRRAEARAELKRAELRLRALGLSAADVDDVRRAEDADSKLAVRAPFAGVVVTREAVQGEVVEAGEGLLTIVDTRTMWARLDVPEAALARVALGQHVVVTVHALPGEQFGGQITWVSTAIDPRTRTLEARAELRNDDGRLRANAFGRAQVTLSDRRDALMVPVDAVQWEGCCNVVFVPEGDSAFKPRKVRLGGATATHVEVLQGVDPDDVVVTVGAFLLKTELLKGSIGAGCCEGE